MHLLPKSNLLRIEGAFEVWVLIFKVYLEFGVYLEFVPSTRDAFWSFFESWSLWFFWSLEFGVYLWRLLSVISKGGGSSKKDLWLHLMALLVFRAYVSKLSVC